MKIQVSLKGLYILTLFAATIVFVWYTNFLKISVSDIQIIDNQIVDNGDGTVNGYLTWCFTEETEPSDLAPFVVCYFDNVEVSKLIDLTAGDECRIRFRNGTTGIWKDQDPYRIFIGEVLNIDPNQITNAKTRGRLAQIFIEG